MRKQRCPFQFYYGWIIVGLAFFSLAFWFGIRTSFSVFYVALSSEFPWRPGPLAGAQGTALVASMVSAPLIGSFIDRHGARNIILLGILITSGGLCLCSTMSSLTEFYLYYGVITGSAVTCVGVVSYPLVIRRWFREKKRGLASGFTVSGIGFGMLTLVPLVQHSIDTWGWRNAFLFLGAIGGLFLFPATFWLLQNRSPLTEKNPLIHSRNGEADQATLTPNHRLSNILTERSLWHFLLFSFCSSVGVYTILVHSVNFLVNQGTNAMVAALCFSLVGAISSVFRILWGWLSDKIGREQAYSIACVSSCLGIGCLLLRDWLGISAFAYLFSLLFGIGWGATAPSVMAASADLFEDREYGFIYGLVQAVINLAGAIGAWLGGAIFEIYQDYTPTFLLAIFALLLSSLFIWMAAPRKNTIQKR